MVTKCITMISELRVKVRREKTTVSRRQMSKMNLTAIWRVGLEKNDVTGVTASAATIGSTGWRECEWTVKGRR